MQVTKDNKTLYHIQSITDYSDEPMDYFIWSERQPTKEQIRKLVEEDLPDEAEKYLVTDVVNNSNVYTVWAEEAER